MLIEIYELMKLLDRSRGMQGDAGGSLDAPPRPLVLDFLWKLNN